jgi:hypothetical protein
MLTWTRPATPNGSVRPRCTGQRATTTSNWSTRSSTPAQTSMLRAPLSTASVPRRCRRLWRDPCRQPAGGARCRSQPLPSGGAGLPRPRRGQTRGRAAARPGAHHGRAVGGLPGVAIRQSRNLSSRTAPRSAGSGGPTGQRSTRRTRRTRTACPPARDARCQDDVRTPL